MKNIFKITFAVLTTLFFFNCKSSDNTKSRLTGLPFNDARYGNFIKGKSDAGQKPPLGMVAVEGGSFTMGQVQDDVMFDWNTTPKKLHVRSFFMDEAEVTNSEYFLYVQYMKNVFPPSEENYKHIYSAILPDTLAWRKSLGNTDILSENYFRNPAYSDYPVVGISWLQANEYCKWRTNAVNLKTLIDKGHIKNIFETDTINNFFDTDVFLTDDSQLFDGDTTVYKRGVGRTVRKRGDPKLSRDAFQGRKITQADGILAQRFRLPTEAEWEFAAKANIENREYNNIRGRKKYAWNEKYSRSKNKRTKGDQLGNFKQGEGQYSGLSGWSSDGADSRHRPMAPLVGMLFAIAVGIGISYLLISNDDLLLEANSGMRAQMLSNIVHLLVSGTAMVLAALLAIGATFTMITGRKMRVLFEEEE